MSKRDPGDLVPTFDHVTGPFPQKVELIDPETHLRRVRTYYDATSFGEAKELSPGAWTFWMWGHIPREAGSAYVVNVLDYREGTGIVLHAKQGCGGHHMASFAPPHPIDARWCRRCAPDGPATL